MEQQSDQVLAGSKDQVNRHVSLKLSQTKSSFEQKSFWLSQLNARHRTLAGKIEKQKRQLATIHNHILYFDSSDPCWLEKVPTLKRLISAQYEELLMIQRDCDEIKLNHADMMDIPIPSTSNAISMQRDQDKVPFTNCCEQSPGNVEKPIQGFDGSNNNVDNSTLFLSLSRSPNSLLKKGKMYPQTLLPGSDPSGYFCGLSYVKKVHEDDRFASYSSSSLSNRAPINEYIDSSPKTNQATASTQLSLLPVHSPLSVSREKASLKSGYLSDSSNYTCETPPPVSMSIACSESLTSDETNSDNHGDQVNSFGSTYQRSFSFNSNMWSGPSAPPMSISSSTNRFEPISPVSYYNSPINQIDSPLSDQNFSIPFHSGQVNYSGCVPSEDPLPNNLENKNMNFSSFPRPCDADINSRISSAKDFMATYCSGHDRD